MITTSETSCYSLSGNYPLFSIVEYLAWKGFHPSRKRGSEYLYKSPLRRESQPSFSVNEEKGLWVDRGMPGKYENQCCLGGSIYLLAELLCGYRSKGIDDINACFSSRAKHSIHKSDVITVNKFGQILKENNLKIKNHREIQHPALLEYMASRGVVLEAANMICREVWYYNNEGRVNFSLGMQNQSGGWELSSRGFKGSIAPKDISLFSNGSDRVVVFEGFFDLLSYISMGIEKRKSFNCDWLCLNSTALVRKAVPVLSSFKEVFLMLDNDPAGTEATNIVMDSNPFASDCRNYFTGYNDFNDWWRIFHKNLSN